MICDLCGQPSIRHRWLTTHEYGQVPPYKKFCVRNEGIFWVAVPKDWESKFLLDELKEDSVDPCDEDYLRSIST